MKSEDFKKQTDEMQKKIGKEKASLIADNFATLISDNLQTNKKEKELEEKIKTLEKEKEDLMTTNMNLLQQIPMGEEIEKPRERKKEEKPKAEAFNYNSVFDEYGNFKR